MIVAIPTYKRHDTIEDKTLRLLAGFKRKDIHLFVSNKEEAALYEPTGCTIVNANANSYLEKINFLQSHFSKGTDVLCMEDDIEEVKYKAGNPVDLLKVSEIAFKATKMNKIGLWGVNASTNKMFIGDKVSLGYKFIVAHVFGFTQGKKPILQTVECKSDYERSIQYYLAYGANLRMDNIWVKTKNYTNKGGLQNEERKAHEEQSVKKLVKDYPLYLERNVNRTSKYPEIKLKR